jgi:hypothetical protein
MQSQKYKANKKILVYPLNWVLRKFFVGRLMELIHTQ